MNGQQNLKVKCRVCIFAYLCFYVRGVATLRLAQFGCKNNIHVVYVDTKLSINGVLKDDLENIRLVTIRN